MTRKELIEEASSEAYAVMGTRPGKSRRRGQCQIRAAISVSMTPYCTTTEIGNAVERDRSSISHYTTNHHDNIEYWEGYKTIYKTVQPVISDILLTGIVHNQVRSIDERIKALEGTKELLLLELD